MVERAPAWTGLAVALAVVAGAPLAAEPPSPVAPLCQASLRLEPERAFVGQQVLYEVRILRRRDVAALSWDRAPSFPAFRAEWLPGISGDDPVERDGESYLVFFERRALFPARDGVLDVPPAGLRCETAESEESVAIPGGRLVVEPLPAAGRPAGHAGLVGPVEVSVTANAPAIELGGSVRVSVAIRGAGNLWDAPPPLPPAEAWDQVEVFPHPPELARDAGRRLRLRRYFVYDLVPRREGELRVPPVELAWFDPSERRYRVAGSQALSVRVHPARQAARVPPPAAPSQAAPPAGSSGLPVARAAWIALAIGGVGLVAGGLALRARRGGRPGVPRAVGELLDEAGAKRGAGDDAAAAAAMARALRAALSERLPDVGALASEEIVARAGDDSRLREAGRLLGRIDRARFEPGAESPELETVRACIDALRA